MLRIGICDDIREEVEKQEKQAFNTFGALSIAAGLFGLQNAVILRIGANIFGSVYTVICNKSLDRLAQVVEQRKKVTA